MKKSIRILALCLILVLALGQPVFAAGLNGRWSGTASVTGGSKVKVLMTVSDGKIRLQVPPFSSATATRAMINPSVSGKTGSFSVATPSQLLKYLPSTLSVTYSIKGSYATLRSSNVSQAFSYAFKVKKDTPSVSKISVPKTIYSGTPVTLKITAKNADYVIIADKDKKTIAVSDTIENGKFVVPVTFTNTSAKKQSQRIYVYASQFGASGTVSSDMPISSGKRATVKVRPAA